MKTLQTKINNLLITIQTVAILLLLLLNFWQLLLSCKRLDNLCSSKECSGVSCLSNVSIVPTDLHSFSHIYFTQAFVRHISTFLLVYMQYRVLLHAQLHVYKPDMTS